MAQFRLLHLSDLHFCARSSGPDAIEILKHEARQLRIHRALFQIRRNGLFSGHNRDRARAVAEFALDHRGELDGIVITGDLATTGLPADLAAARAFVDSPAARDAVDANGNATLAASELRIMLLPGNHDRYATGGGHAGGTGFETHFSGHWATSNGVQHALFRFGGKALGIVAADFALQSDGQARPPAIIGRLGQGKAHGSVIEESKDRTRRLRRMTDGIVWAVHFPPDPPGETTWLRLLDAGALVEAARASGVGHILADHIHKDCTYPPPPADVVIRCAHSACSSSVDGGNGFQILEIDVGTLGVTITEQAYRLSTVVDDFEPA